tara:strand:- start:1179 stop:1445 length:267 start_codon:yes stop_codon:yes gene_type:complete
LGGFLASVRAIGVVQPPGIKVSAEETVRGGADGSFFFFGGGTNPSSVEPSLAPKQVPIHKVAAMRWVNFIINYTHLYLSLKKYRIILY